MVGDPLVVGDHLIETFSEDLASAVWWSGVFPPINTWTLVVELGSFLIVHQDTHDSEWHSTSITFTSGVAFRQHRVWHLTAHVKVLQAWLKGHNLRPEQHLSLQAHPQGCAVYTIKLLVWLGGLKGPDPKAELRNYENTSYKKTVLKSKAKISPKRLFLMQNLKWNLLFFTEPVLWGDKMDWINFYLT